MPPTSSPQVLVDSTHFRPETVHLPRPGRLAGVVMRRRVEAAQGRAALDQWWESGQVTPRPVVATAVRFALEELAARSPGNTVEVRVPPFGATQCVEGPRHTRGTPPNVIETDPTTWLELACGIVTWDDAVADHRITASGLRADLADQLPLFRRR